MEVSKTSSGKSPLKDNGKLPPDPAKRIIEIRDLLSAASKITAQTLAKRPEVSEPLSCVGVSLASGTNGLDPVCLRHEVIILDLS